MALTICKKKIPLKRFFSFLISVAFLITLCFDSEASKYLILMVAPWVYLLAGAPVYRPDGVIVFFYYLYSISYPTFLLLVGDSADLSKLLDATNTAYAGIFFAIAVFFPRSERISTPKLSPGFSRFLYWISFTLLPILVVLSVLIIMQYGLGSKREINDSGGILAYINLGVYALFVYGSIYICNLIAARNSYYLKFSFLLLLALIYLLLVGERDILFRYLFVVGIFWISITNKFKSYYYLLGLVFILGVVSISQQMKNLFLTGSLYEARENGLAWLFYNDFISGSRNLYHVIKFGKNGDGVNLIAGDILRFFNGFGLMENVKSATQWYNEYYRNVHHFSGSSGWGFSIVAEFYYSYGKIGVFSGMFILMSVTNIMYRYCWTSVVGRVFLLLYYSSFIYSFRSDLANFLGLTIKWGFVIILFAYIVYLILLVASKGHVRSKKI
jgi:hypothetical protein